MVKKKTTVKSHTRKTPSGKITNVVQHLRKLPKTVRKKLVVAETEKEKKQLQELQEQLKEEEERQERKRKLLKVKKKEQELKGDIKKEKLETLEKLRETVTPELRKDYQVFEADGVWEVKKGLFDRHAFGSKEEAMDYVDFRVENDLRQEAGLSKEKKKFDFQQLPEIKNVEKFIGKTIRGLQEARERGRRR